MSSIFNIIKKHEDFIKYLLISGFVTILDIVTSWGCEFLLPILIANSIGIITGFVVQYFMTTKYVYNKKNIKVFLKFFITFIIGFILANLIVYICREFIFDGKNNTLAFLISKGLSIVIPFFVMYYIRKIWITDKK